MNRKKRMVHTLRHMAVKLTSLTKVMTLLVVTIWGILYIVLEMYRIRNRICGVIEHGIHTV